MGEIITKFPIISDFYVTYIIMRPLIFLFIGICCTIFGYIITASRCEKFQRNEQRRFIADIVGFLLAVSGPLIFIYVGWIM